MSLNRRRLLPSHFLNLTVSFLSCRSWRQTVRWGGVGLTSDDWRQPLVRPDVRTFFFGKKISFFFKKMKKPLFFPLKTGPLGPEETQYSPTVHRWWDVQSKQTRQTYRQSSQSTRRQFTKRWKRITRPRYTVGSITRLRFVWFTSNYVHFPPHKPLENRVTKGMSRIQPSSNFLSENFI